MAGPEIITHHVVPFHPEQDRYEPAPDHTITIAAVWRNDKPGWLSANQRWHWSTAANLTRSWRRCAGWQARADKVPALGPSLVVAKLHMAPRRRVRIDPANYAPTAKACVDGLVDAGIWPDDSSGWVTGPDMRLGPPVKTPDQEALVLQIFGSVCCAAGTCYHHREVIT